MCNSSIISWDSIKHFKFSLQEVVITTYEDSGGGGGGGGFH